LAARTDRARFARGGQAVAGRSNIGSSGSDRRRRGRVQAQKCTLSRGERDIGKVVLWLEERVQGHENIKEQKRLQEEQREVVIDRVIVKYPASAVERPVRIECSKCNRRDRSGRTKTSRYLRRPRSRPVWIRSRPRSADSYH
jgi:hypothetical protein